MTADRNRARGLFVTGTDTGVGKTFVAACLAAALRERGFRVGVMKPVETGCVLSRGRRIPRDGLVLKRAAAAAEPIELIVPYRLKAPLAPLAAAAMEGIRIRPDRLERAYERVVSRCSFTLVEGAGGVLVPITDRLFMADLIARFALPALVVARAGLGTLNHTLLTVSFLQGRGLPVAGVVLNDVDGKKDLSKKANAALLRQRLRVPILGQIPFRKELGIRNAARMKQASLLAGRHMDLAVLLRRAGLPLR